MDAETLRWREMQDRKGSLVFVIRHAATGNVFDVRHATTHTRRFDIFCGGKRIATTRADRILECIA